MKKKTRLLLLDANIVIELFRLGLWEKVVEKCDVWLSRLVAETEAKYYGTGSEHARIDLKPYGADGRIQVVDVEAPSVAALLSRFGPLFLERLDPGEAESLAHLVASADPYLICSADKIVFRVLGCLHRSEQGISLEEILQQIGLGRSVQHQYTKEYRMQWTRQGWTEGLTGLDRPVS